MSELHPQNDSLSQSVLQPPCSVCGVPMWLMRLSSVDEKYDLRTFQCQVCTRTETVLADR